MRTPYRDKWTSDCGTVTLYCGDCREILPTLGKVDAVVTDPPYGIGLEYGVFEDSEENVKDLVGMFVPWSIENASRTLITSGNQCQHLYPRPKWTLAWVTPAGAGSGPWGFSCWQPILAYGSCPYLTAGKGRRSDIFVHTEASEKNGHPCPKPLNFMNKLVERASLVNQIVLDPFMGSGTTGVACVRLGRRFIGIELEPKYYAIAKRRIKDELARVKFLEPPKRETQRTLLEVET